MVEEGWGKVMGNTGVRSVRDSRLWPRLLLMIPICFGW